MFQFTGVITLVGFAIYGVIKFCDEHVVKDKSKCVE